MLGGGAQQVVDIDLHRPHVDELGFTCTAEGCAGVMHRTPEVIDAWFDSDLNNARLVPVSTYARLVPAFRELFRRADEDLDVFYQECAALGALPA